MVGSFRMRISAAFSYILHLRSGWIALCLIALALLLVEAGLQWRAYRQTGQTLFQVEEPQGEPTMAAKAGIKTYPANTVIRGHEIEIRTNAYGLRSPQLKVEPDENELRLAVIGASTVAGAYTPKNEQLFSQQLVPLLQRHHMGPVSVINAGIPGATVRDMGKMLDVVIAPLQPRYAIIYTGFNDIAKICKANTKKIVTPIRMAYPQLPERLLLPELVKKNTSSLRSTYDLSGTGLRRSNKVSPEAINTYRAETEELARVAKRRNIELVFVSSLTAYRKEMSRSRQEALSTSALYYVKCLDLDGLYNVTETLNSIQAETAKKHGFDYVDLRKVVQGGQENFVDSNHFSVAGELVMAVAINNFLDKKMK